MIDTPPSAAKRGRGTTWCLLILRIALVACLCADSQARTIYRCYRDGTVSLASAPEPGSRCTAIKVDDDAARLPNLWGSLAKQQGALYERQQDGKAVYSTRNLPGSIKVLSFTVPAPPGAQAHTGLGKMGPPRLEMYAKPFRAAAKASGVEEAWLRAIAHAESGFDPLALSPKGAMGVMQLMPDTAALYGVADPHAAEQSIRAGARHLRKLIDLYQGDLTLVAAAYNAGIATVTRYGGVPPYAETREYVARVLLLHARYREALAAQAASALAKPE